jgi:hypothetical protein
MVVVVGTLPADARQMTVPEWLAVSQGFQRLKESVRGDHLVLKRYEARSYKLTNKAQVEELRATLQRFASSMDATEAYHRWWVSSGASEVVRPDVALELRDPTDSLKQGRKWLRRLGDTTSPDWRPGWRARLRAAIIRRQLAARETNAKPPPSTPR